MVKMHHPLLLVASLLACLASLAAAFSVQPGGRGEADDRGEQAELRHIMAELELSRQPEGGEDYTWPGDDVSSHDITDEAAEAPGKRSGSRGKLQPVPFYCNKQTAFCRNGGVGPKVTFKRGGGGSKDTKPVCVCLCPTYSLGPQCKTPRD